VPNIQICASYFLTGIEAITAPNGGSVRGYQEPATPTIPTTAEQTGGQAVSLCIASAPSDRTLLPR
jgi:hypothetical protein